MLTYVTQPSEWFFTHTRCKQLIWIFHWRTTSSFIWFLQFDSMLLAAFSDCSRLSNGPRLESLKLHQKNHIDIDLRQQLKPAYDMFVAAMKHATAPHSTRKEMYIFICFDFQFRLHLNDNVIRGWETFWNRQTLCRQKKMHCIHFNHWKSSQSKECQKVFWSKNSFENRVSLLQKEMLFPDWENQAKTVSNGHRRKWAVHQQGSIFIHITKSLPITKYLSVPCWTLWCKPNDICLWISYKYRIHHSE